MEVRHWGIAQPGMKRVFDAGGIYSWKTNIVTTAFDREPPSKTIRSRTARVHGTKIGGVVTVDLTIRTRRIEAITYR
jgi:hypothetical protein